VFDGLYKYICVPVNLSFRSFETSQILARGVFVRMNCHTVSMMFVCMCMWDGHAL